jgi:hypothetical protein
MQLFPAVTFAAEDKVPDICNPALVLLLCLP